MKQVILAILFFGLCINAQVERHTLQGALNLLEQAQNDIIHLVLLIKRWICKAIPTDYREQIGKSLCVFGSVPAVIFMAGFMPMILLVVFSYGMFKFITYEPKKMEFKYSKLPIKDVPKPQNNKLQFPAFGLFSFI